MFSSQVVHARHGFGLHFGVWRAPRLRASGEDSEGTLDHVSRELHGAGFHFERSASSSLRGAAPRLGERVKHTEPESLMFATWSGKPISPNNVVRRWIVPACKTLGLQRVTWLTLRRTYSSWAHEKGVPGKVIAQLMGHAKVDTTLNVYTQVIDGSLRRAADTVGSECSLLCTNRTRHRWDTRRRRPPERSEGKR